MPEYAWKIFFEMPSKMVSVIPSNKEYEAQTLRNHHHFARSNRTVIDLPTCVIQYNVWYNFLWYQYMGQKWKLFKVAVFTYKIS